MSKQTQRNYGIDLLRCLSMLFVIILHLLGQGGLVENATVGSGKFYLLSFLQILSQCAVNLYGITTGYLMCQKTFRLSRISNIWLTTVFWSVAVSCCFFIAAPEYRTIKEAVSMFLPILRGRYWFFTAYFVVMLISPILNVLIRTISRRQYHLMLAALFLLFGVIPFAALGYDVMRISGGNHFSWMIVLYLIGGYIRTHSEDTRTDSLCCRKWLLLYFAAAAAHLLYKFLVAAIGFSHYGSLFLTNPSPFTVAEAVFLFLFFCGVGKSISPKSPAAKFLRFAAPGVYSVYIIHVHPLVFWSQDLISLLRPWDSFDTLTVLASVLAAAFGVFVVCILLDAVRQRIFALLHVDNAVGSFSHTIENKIRTFLS